MVEFDDDEVHDDDADDDDIGADKCCTIDAIEAEFPACGSNTDEVEIATDVTWVTLSSCSAAT